MQNRNKLLLVIIMLIATSLACTTINNDGTGGELTPTFTPGPTSTAILPAPVQPGSANPDEPVVIQGEIPYTSPFFEYSLEEPFVLLEDQAGFVQRDHEFVFSLEGQSIGPVEKVTEGLVKYVLPLPAVLLPPTD